MDLVNIQNLLLGFAIGDAFGAGIEFQDRDWIKANVDLTKFVNARTNIKVPKDQKIDFTRNYHSWDYTDDTEMTVGLMKALITDEVFSEELLIRKWKEEYELGKQTKGYGRNGHGSMAWYYSGEKTIEEIRFFQRNRTNPGNAPAMRSVPLGFVAEHLINDYAAINANATHPNDNAIIASQCIARATEFLLVKNGDAKKVMIYCQETVGLNKDYQTYFKTINQLPDYELLSQYQLEQIGGVQPIKKPYFLAGIKGIPSDSKYTTGAVLYLLKHSNNPFDVLKKAIYLGGDVDSLAAITTGILAGKYGLSSLPNFMLEKVEGTQYLKEIANQFYQKMKI